MTDISSLTAKHCVPCEGGQDPLNSDQEKMYLSAVPEWQLESTSTPHTIERNFTRKNFQDALAFVQQIGQIAEQEGHHPDICIHDYKQVRVTLTTHAIAGLSENDFILAAKINELIATKTAN